MPRAKKSEPAEPKEPKAKKVNVKLIDVNDPVESEANREALEILLHYRHTYHEHLADLSIGLAWRYGWKPDKDNHMILGQCKKRSDLDREFSDDDFVILLNYETWHAPWFDRKKKEALIDHELCHAKKVYDKNGEPKKDARGRFVGRSRRGHDVEEFIKIIQRHGIWKSDLAAMARAMHAQSEQPLLPPPDEPLPSEAVQEPLAENDEPLPSDMEVQTAEDPFPSTVPLPRKGRGSRRRKAE